jgi:hypothetical protein
MDLYCVRLDSDDFIGITFENPDTANSFYKHQEAFFPGLFEVPKPGKTTVWIRRVFTSAHIDKLGFAPPSRKTGEAESSPWAYTQTSSGPGPARLVQACADFKRKADQMGIFAKVSD